MVVDLSVGAISSFLTITSLLIIYSILDIRERRVPNEYIAAGGVVGGIVILLTGHLVSNLILHVTAIIIMFTMSYALFRIGSIGGADAKSLLLVALISPGIELKVLNIPVLEAVLGMGGELMVMLLGGYLYWRFQSNHEKGAPPLIPFLLLGYLVIQLLTLPLGIF